MRPLIYSKSHSLKNRYFITEEDRLRKSTKGCLEAIDLSYTTSVFANYDLVHFINTKDIKKLNDVKEANLPIVINAMYCENDKRGALSELKNTKRILKNKARKCLNAADIVLVPGVSSKQFLEEEGVSSKIEVFPIPINFKRFDIKDEYEKNLFYRYFTERKKINYIVCVGDYKNKKEMNHLIELAELSNFIKFYFLGSNSTNSIINKYKKKGPSNVVFSKLVEDDVFRSALVNASGYLVLDVRKAESITIFEAMASKIQVFVYGGDNKVESYLKDGFNCYIKSGIFDLSNLIFEYIKHRQKSTITNAYKYVQKYNLVNSGKHLEKIYKELLKQ